MSKFQLLGSSANKFSEQIDVSCHDLQIKLNFRDNFSCSHYHLWQLMFSCVPSELVVSNFRINFRTGNFHFQTFHFSTFFIITFYRLDTLRRIVWVIYSVRSCYVPMTKITVKQQRIHYTKANMVLMERISENKVPPNSN